MFLDNLDGYIEKNNGNMILQIKTNKHLKVTKNYGKKLNWSQIETLNDDEPVEYRKDFMKIKFESDDDLPLGKTFNILDMIIVVASVLEKKW